MKESLTIATLNSTDMTTNMDINDMDTDPSMNPLTTQERESNSQIQHCTITKVNGFQYLTLPETKLMDYVVEDKNIETAVSAVRDETNDPHLPVSEIRVEMCNYILESDEMKELIRQDLLRGVYNPEAIAADMNLKDRIEGLPSVFEATLSQIIQTMVKQVLEDAYIKRWAPLFPEVTYEYIDLGYFQKISEESLAKGYKYWISIKLDSFYDKIPHDRLMQALRVFFQDDRVFALVKELLFHNSTKNTGFPKDSPLSCLIGHIIFLFELDDATTDQSESNTVSMFIFQYAFNRGFCGLNMLLAFINAVLFTCKEAFHPTKHRSYKPVTKGAMWTRGKQQQALPVLIKRWGDEIVVFCDSKEMAEKTKQELIDYIENTMKCPVNRELTRIGNEEYLSVFGMDMKHGHWTIAENLKQDAHAKYLNKLMEYTGTKDESILCDACAEMCRFTGYYKKDFEDDCIALWTKCENDWKSFVGSNTSLFHRCFPKPWAYEFDFKDLI